jgi:N-carbamoylputrescine amidase
MLPARRPTPVRRAGQIELGIEGVMRITVCEFPDDPIAVAPAWDRLIEVLDAEPTNLLVLPELAAAGSFWTRPAFDQAIWREAVARHAQLPAQLKRLAAQRVLGTRAVEVDGRRLNESFLWTAARGLIPGRAKAWLPEQEGGREATWFDHGAPDVELVEDDGLCLATLICTEIMVSAAPRALGRAGVQLIAVPRATGGHRRWEVATQMAAISAGAFVATANRRGRDLTGGSWIIDPDGDELARTDAATPIVTIEIDLSEADNAKLTYPRVVKNPPGKPEVTS